MKPCTALQFVPAYQPASTKESQFCETGFKAGCTVEPEMRCLLFATLCLGVVTGFRLPADGSHCLRPAVDARSSRPVTAGSRPRPRAPVRHVAMRSASAQHGECCIAELARNGQWGSAVEALAHMEQTAASPSKTAYDAVIGALTSNGQWEQALEVYDRAFGAGGKLASQADTSTYEAGMAACVKGRLWTRAFEIYESLEQSGVKTSFTQKSLEALCRREASRSFQLLEPSDPDMKLRGVRPHACSSPAPAFLKGDDVSSSVKWVEDNPAGVGQQLVEEGMVWIRGACADATLLAAAAAQVDQNLVTALARASADDESSDEEQARWFGMIRARTHRYDLRQQLVGPVQQVVQEVVSRVRAPLSLAMASDDAEVVEFSCIVADPGAPAQTLHYDTPLLPEEGGYRGFGASLFTVFIPLQDISVDMGATCLLPGSHTSVEAHEAFAQDRARHDAIEERKGRGEPARGYLGEALLQDASRACRVFAATAGDALVMDSRTLHCGGENTSDQRRRLLYVTFHSRAAAPSANEEGFAKRPAHSTYSLLDEYSGRFKLSSAGEWV